MLANCFLQRNNPCVHLSDKAKGCSCSMYVMKLFRRHFPYLLFLLHVRKEVLGESLEPFFQLPGVVQLFALALLNKTSAQA